jgi:sulfate transport system permease protein
MTSIVGQAGWTPPRVRRRRIMPGFGLTAGVTLTYLGVIVLAPLAALLLKATGLGPVELWRGITSPRALASYQLTFACAFVATVFNAFAGSLFAWILARYRFPGRRILDGLIDLPFALPTSVAGITLSAIFAPTGWAGALLEPLGLKVAYAPAGIAIAMAFTSLPFVVRTLQPVIEELDGAEEEAAFTLGADNRQILSRVLAPSLRPALISGCAMAFTRALCEYGAVIFIAGNLPYKTEVTTLLINIRLEEFDYPSAAALAVVLLAASFVTLFLINALQFRRRQRESRG